MIKRVLESVIRGKINDGRAIVILGPRRTGKTTLVEFILKTFNSFLLLDCDDPLVRSKLENANTEQIRQLFGDHKLIFIDEAQRVRNIGVTVKIMVDRFKQVQVIVSGSSSLELASEISEPLTGRKWPFMLYPVSWQELRDHAGVISSLQQLNSRLVYGMYPEVIMRPGLENQILAELTDSYLFKDILSFGGIRKPDILEKLLRALAFQVGNEVSFNELATQVQVDKNTIMNYINLLEKNFIVFRLNPFKRNLRNEISTSRKIYFYDNGIRNALISNFLPIDRRQDTGALWENFVIAERMKFLQYQGIRANCHFWRTVSQQEIDLIEERDGKITAYEMKWNPKARLKEPKSFLETYQSEIRLVTPSNFEDFLTA